MKRVTLPQPPNPDEPQYRGNQLAFNRAAADWMRRAKGLIEDASRINDAPLGQNFLATNFTTNTTVTGTTTGTDLSNAVASLVAAFTAKGIISPTISRNQE